MRKFWLAALAASTVLGAAPALADHDYRDDRHWSQRERAADAAERTRIAQERNSQRIYAETRRRQAANNARLRREAVARQRGNSYDHAYYDDAAYDRGRLDAEREFRRFADRNRDGQVSRREYEWAIARW
jgi:hypothetical protein